MSIGGMDGESPYKRARVEETTPTKKLKRKNKNGSVGKNEEMERKWTFILCAIHLLISIVKREWI